MFFVHSVDWLTGWRVRETQAITANDYVLDEVAKGRNGKKNRADRGGKYFTRVMIAADEPPPPFFFLLPVAYLGRMMLVSVNQHPRRTLKLITTMSIYLARRQTGAVGLSGSRTLGGLSSYGER